MLIIKKVSPFFVLSLVDYLKISIYGIYRISLIEFWGISNLK